MKTFKQHLKEATLPNWTSVVNSNPELKAAIELMAEIETLGGEALLVGGIVRDLLMGNKPHDVDIATDVPMEKLYEHFEIYDIGKSKNFGVALIKYKGFQFEVAQYRADIYEEEL